MISVSNLTKNYGPRKAIDNVSFQVEKGEVVGFLGPNGAGKSTTMKIITGYMAPTSGVAKICGYDVFESPLEVKSRIGYLPETPPLYLDMRVDSYLRYVAKLKGVARSDLAAFVNRAVEKTNLQEVRGRYIQHLSKGFRQRVGIAQALVSNPEVLVLDEPTVGLDPKQVAEIRNLIQDLRGEHTVILSTHILPEVQAACERIIIIHQGKIVAQDDLKNLDNRMKGSRKVKIRVLKPDRLDVAALQQVRGVTAARRLEGQEFEVSVEPNDESLSELSAAVVQSGAGLTELVGEKVSLEEVFLNLTYDQKSEVLEGGASL